MKSVQLLGRSPLLYVKFTLFSKKLKPRQFYLTNNLCYLYFAETNLNGGNKMYKLLKIFSLVILLSGFSSLAQSNPCKIDPARCEQADGLHGVWNFLEVTLHEEPEIGLGPFPTSITIEATGLNQGKVTLQLRTQSKVKVYPFSKIEPTKEKTIQVYDKPDATFEFKPHTLEEMASISYSEDVLKVNLEWIKKNENDEIEWVVPGSYTFTLEEDLLIFHRTNDKDAPEENRIQTRFEAHYQRTQVTE